MDTLKPSVSPFISQKFRFYSFLSMLLLVFVHGYNLQDTYLQPWSLVREPMTFTSFTEYLLANGLFRFRIPMLFIISGYLYALSDYKPYKERTNKRLRTLGIPYLFWSLFALLLTLGLEYSPAFLKAIQETRLAQVSEHSILVSQYVWYEWLIRIFLAPIAFQLWFIRVLLVYNVAYPYLRWCVQKIPFVWFPIAVFLWFFTFGTLILEGEGLLFLT
jgi:fucose 4-O-acetylase-like acetyltransferase